MKTVHLPDEHVRLFNTLEIEIGAQCNRQCVFCPVTPGDRPDEFMDRDLITKMVEELKALNWRGRVTTYIYNEPMRHPELLDIVAFMRRELPRVCIMVSTNGDYVKHRDDITKVFQAGVNQLLVNIYSAQDLRPEESERFGRGVALAQRRYETFTQWRQELLQEGLIQPGQGVYTYISPRNRIMRVDAKFGVKKTDKKISSFELANRSGNIPWFQPATAEPLAKSCVRPFRNLNINWRGQALLCCNDYHGMLDFGNVRQHSLVDIWHHPDFYRYRLHLQHKDRNLPLCDKCDYSGGPYTHMVEPITYGEAEDRRILAQGREALTVTGV